MELLAFQSSFLPTLFMTCPATKKLEQKKLCQGFRTSPSKVRVYLRAGTVMNFKVAFALPYCLPLLYMMTVLIWLHSPVHTIAAHVDSCAVKLSSVGSARTNDEWERVHKVK